MPIVIMKLGQWRVTTQMNVLLMTRLIYIFFWEILDRWLKSVWQLFAHIIFQYFPPVEFSHYCHPDKAILLVVWYMNLHEIIYLICLLCMVVHADFIYALWINSTWNILRPCFRFSLSFWSEARFSYHFFPFSWSSQR